MGAVGKTEGLRWGSSVFSFFLRLPLLFLILTQLTCVLYLFNSSQNFFRKVTTCECTLPTSTIPNSSAINPRVPQDAGLATTSYLLLLILLSRQTDLSRTPAGISRVSRWSFLTQSIVDSVSFAGHITFAILADGRPSLSLVGPAFLACILFIYEAVGGFVYLFVFGTYTHTHICSLV